MYSINYSGICCLMFALLCTYYIFMYVTAYESFSIVSGIFHTKCHSSILSTSKCPLLLATNDGELYDAHACDNP